MLRLLACAAAFGLTADPARADGLSGPPPFDLALTRATAERFANGGVLIICDVVLDNRTGKDVNVRSNFFSPFDGLWLYVRDGKGKLLLRRAYIAHQSPATSDGRELPLKPGANRGELRFPVDLPADVTAIRVGLAGTLPGSGRDEILVSDVVSVTIIPTK